MAGEGVREFADRVAREAETAKHRAHQLSKGRRSPRGEEEGDGQMVDELRG